MRRKFKGAQKEMNKGGVGCCVEIKILRRVRAESSRRHPRHRRDACSMAWRCRFLTARPSQDGRVIAENDLVKNCRVHPTHWLIHTGRLAQDDGRRQEKEEEEGQKEGLREEKGELQCISNCRGAPTHLLICTQAKDREKQKAKKAKQKEKDKLKKKRE